MSTQPDVAQKNATGATQLTFLERLRKRRRKKVKRYGKLFIRGVAGFLGRQGLIDDAPIIDKALFPSLKPLEDKWQTVRTELDEILEHREAVPLFQEVSPDQKKISIGDNWRTFILFGFGGKSVKNCRQAPETAKLLEAVPNLQSAWFSIISPGYHIPPHRGVTKGIIRCHLGLIVPKEAEKCYMRVDDQICVWREGEAFVFDDTYEHEVRNDTDEERVVLILDFDRPMRLAGRLLNKTFIALLKFTAYYQEPKKAMRTYEDQFEAAVRRANENMEKLSEDA